MQLWKWKHIIDLDERDSVYLSRLMLFKSRLFGVYVHRILRPDYARCEHDHPWPFVTVILRGGYEEEIGGKLHIRRPGYVGYRPRAFQHRITRLLNGPALTLVFRGPDAVDWGFKTVHGMVPWQEYVQLPSATRVLWCDDSLGAAAREAKGPTAPEDLAPIGG